MGKVNINAGLIGMGSRAPVLETLNATENATYTPGTGVDGFNEVNVNVEADLEDATFTENGTYESQDHDGFRSVEVNVSGGNANERELSAEEYMALTEAEKINGTNYYIYDAMPEGKEIQPIIYSTVEREIGVWTDGKPLYQKTFISTYSSRASDPYNITFDIHDLLVDTVVSIDGIWERWAGDNSKLLYTVNSYESSNYTMYARVDSENGYHNGKINCVVHSDGIDYTAITLRYTKTTDTPGSGIWAPSGVPAVHYDSNEKIIGTWFGETLYEKTVISTSNLSYGATNPIQLNIDNVDRFISVEGFVSYGNNTRFIPLPYGDRGNSTICITSLSSTEGVANIYVGSDYSGQSTVNLVLMTIQYTKTTS